MNPKIKWKSSNCTDINCNWKGQEGSKNWQRKTNDCTKICSNPKLKVMIRPSGISKIKISILFQHFPTKTKRKKATTMELLANCYHPFQSIPMIYDLPSWIHHCFFFFFLLFFFYSVWFLGALSVSEGIKLITSFYSYSSASSYSSGTSLGTIALMTSSASLLSLWICWLNHDSWLLISLFTIFCAPLIFLIFYYASISSSILF